MANRTLDNPALMHEDETCRSAGQHEGPSSYSDRPSSEQLRGGAPTLEQVLVEDLKVLTEEMDLQTGHIYAELAAHRQKADDLITLGEFLENFCGHEQLLERSGKEDQKVKSVDEFLQRAKDTGNFSQQQFNFLARTAQEFFIIERLIDEYDKVQPQLQTMA